jgi:hypothetical protein
MILFPYIKNEKGDMRLILEQELKIKFPLTYHYLLDHKEELENRERGRMKGSDWYAYIYPKALDVMSLPKIFTPDIAPTSSFSHDASGEIFFTGGVSGGYGILVNSKYSKNFVYGLLNSQLLDWFNKQIATVMRGGYYSYESRFIKNWPIQLGDQATQNNIASSVEQLLELHQKLAAAQTAHEKTILQRQIAATDNQIDQLVYQLYNLTPEEIAIVEGG